MFRSACFRAERRHKNVPEAAHERVHAARDGERTWARILTVDEENETAEVQWLDRYGLATSEVPLDDCVLRGLQDDVGVVVIRAVDG